MSAALSVPFSKSSLCPLRVFRIARRSQQQGGRRSADTLDVVGREGHKEGC